MTAWMSQEDYDANAELVATEVNAILGAKGKSRRRFRVTALYERASGDLVAEVLRTSLGPVVVSYGGDMNSVVPGPYNPDQQLRGFRRDRGQRKIEPLTDDPKQVFILMGSSESHFLFGVHIHARWHPGDALVFGA